MGNEEDLRNIGLTKYEAKAFICIIKHEIVDAKTICKEENIPSGKIYETLSSLVRRNFIEVQNTRPKKYHAVKLSNAFELFYNEKKKNMDNELNKTKKLLDVIGENLSHKNKVANEETNFWKAAFKEDIPKLMMECFENADEEVNMLFIEPVNYEEFDKISGDLVMLIKKMTSLSKRGVKLRILRNKKTSDRLMDYFGESKKEINKFTKEIEQDISDLFLVFDNEVILMQITNPLNKNELLAMIKVWNPKLAKELNQKFMVQWKKGTYVKE